MGFLPNQSDIGPKKSWAMAKPIKYTVINWPGAEESSERPYATRISSKAGRRISIPKAIKAISAAINERSSLLPSVKL